MYFATHHFSTQVLNTFRGITANGYNQLFVGLFISDPTSTGTSGIEIIYEGYQRQPIQFTPPADFNGHLAIRNAQDITWPLSEQSPGTVRHIGIFDSQVGGQMLLRGDLTIPLEIRPNQQPSVLAGDIIYWSRGDFSNSFKESCLNILRGVTLPGFTSHVAMFDGNPESGGVELNGENYSRPAVVFAAPHVSDNGVVTMVNEQTVSFPTPLETWGRWAYDAIMRGDVTAQTATKSLNAEAETIHRNYVGRFAQGAIRISHD